MLTNYQKNHGTPREDLPIEMNLKKETTDASRHSLHHQSRQQHHSAH